MTVQNSIIQESYGQCLKISSKGREKGYDCISSRKKFPIPENGEMISKTIHFQFV